MSVNDGIDRRQALTSERGSGASRLRCRSLVLLLIALVLAGFYLSGGYQRLSWESLRDHIDILRSWTREHPAAALLAFVALYVVATALSLPVAAGLGLIAGTLFGRWVGTIAVSFASTLGATLAFLTVRYLLRDYARQRWERRLRPVMAEVDRAGAYHLLALRLLPLAPYFVVNAAMGLTPMRLRTFWWASQVGMLPATFLYVNAGTELGSIRTPRDALSPAVLLSLALVSLLPLLVRQMLCRRRNSHPDEGRR